MRNTITLSVAIALGLLTPADLFGQCQRGGGGGRSQQTSMPLQSSGFTQNGFNPTLAIQQAAAQQAFMQQQFAAQHMQMCQIAQLEEARQTQLARRRATAQKRRAEVFARREEVRAANLAKPKATEPQETLVALKSE